MKPSSVHELLDSLFQIRDSDRQRERILRPDCTPSLELIEALSARIREQLPRDRRMAEMLAEVNLLLASRLELPLGWAFAHQCKAYVFMNMRRCAEAQPHFEQAARLFEADGAPRELGRTLCAEAENLTHLGEYARARGLAERARDLIEAAGDAEHRPRVHLALGALFMRMNQFGRALDEYDQARAAAAAAADQVVAAAAEMNRATALTELHRFSEAIEGFETAREHCLRRGIALWSDILDRNIADLYFKLGRYGEALASLEAVRTRYREQHDLRRLALCDLARAEIYLQLNLPLEAAELAGQARPIFEEHSNRLEAAHCLTLVGIGQAESGEGRTAEGSFLAALEVFRAEGNAVSTAAVNLQLARLEHRRGRFAAAAALGREAAAAFEAEGLAVRGAYARIVLAHSLKDLGEPEAALDEAGVALAGLTGFHAQWVSYQGHSLLAALQADRGDDASARRLYRQAIEEMESLRGAIQLDEFRMSFGKDKYQVYEDLVRLTLAAGDGREAFALVERSKSRTLLDLLERSTASLWSAAGASEADREIARRRQELNALYSRLAQIGATVSASASGRRLREEIGRREQELLARLREAGARHEAWAAPETMPAATVEDVQRMLGPDEALIEYYAVGPRFCAFLVTRSTFEVFRDLGEIGEVRAILKGLNFQLSKFQLSEAYLSDRRELLLAAAQYHLKKLYDLLLAPFLDRVPGESLLIVPHHVLHYVPFQALYDGARHLIDRCDVVHGASAAVLKLCRAAAPQPTGEDLVLAVPDDDAPAIREEAAALAALLPAARVFVGAEARVDRLREYGPRADRVHIAAHGVFRGDNPMFSAIRLGDAWLNLVDIFNLRLGAELTTLSACETGLNLVEEGDELLGLARGFLYAGTPALVVSLWRVSDRSTARLMARFYQGLLAGRTKPQSLREAVLEVKQEFPHPYYWAPFVVMGKS